MRLAVLGGSFNPIHAGHLYLADLVLAAGWDRVLFVPANISPFKRHGGETGDPGEGPPAPVEVPPAADRLDMVLAAVSADPRLDVDDLELRRGGVSYTVDTLREIRDRRGVKPGLILGDDLAADFSRWREAGEISRLADIIVARRLGAPPASFPYPCRFLDNEVMNLSSAVIRERIASGGAWRSLVPPGARHIIEERRLYGAPGGGGDEPSPALTAAVEDAARRSLSPGRFLHSRGTALLARDIALRYGLSGPSAYLAGIAHDLAKTREPGLGHGPAAAVLLRERFGIHNRDILEAVELHTTGRSGMGDLARAVFIADKIEYSRRNAGDALRKTAFSSLDEWFYAVLEDTARRLGEAGIGLAENTLRLLAERG